MRLLLIGLLDLTFVVIGGLMIIYQAAQVEHSFGGLVLLMLGTFLMRFVPLFGLYR